MINEQLKVKLDEQTGTPYYEQLYQGIRANIRNGLLKPGTPFPSEREFMESLGIARTTLRRALEQLEKEGLVSRRHGVGTFVSEPRRWRTLGKIIDVGIVTWGEELGNRSKEILSQLCTEAVSLGLQVHTMRVQSTDVMALENQCSDLKLQGLISMATQKRRHLEQLAEVSIPKVILELKTAQEGLDHVVIDSFAAVYEGVNELIRLGHKEIAYVGGLLVDVDESNGATKQYKMAQDSDDRCRAYRRALEDAGLQYRPELYFELPYDAEPVNAWLPTVKAAGKLPTAFVVFSDSLANLVVNACRANGLRVPEDVSVIGFGNSIPESKSGELATGVWDSKEMARLAAQRINERATHGGMSGVSLSVATRFKPGQSIGRARATAAMK